MFQLFRSIFKLIVLNRKCNYSHRMIEFYMFCYCVMQVIVVHIGTNNVSNSAEEIAEGIFEIVRAIREKLSEVYIVLPVSVTSSIKTFY